MELLHGVDLEQISRFEKLIIKETFMTRIYTDRERAYIEKSPHPARTAAGMWASKEAVAKAFGRGLFGMLPREIEVLHLPSGQPQAVLRGKAAEDYGNYSLSLSITHSGDTVLASCIAWQA